MKCKKSSDIVPSIFLSVVGVILVGIIICYVQRSVETTTNLADVVIENTEEIASEYADYDIKIYDREEVRGSEVVNFIKKHLGNYEASEEAPIYIKVQNHGDDSDYTNTYTNKVYLEDIKNFSSLKHYIKPTAIFVGEVIYSTNRTILGVKFSQI